MTDTLQTLLDVGDQIKQAIGADDMTAFYELIQERETLVQTLTKPASSRFLTEEDAQALDMQFNEIMAAIKDKETQMMEQLQSLDRLKKASHSYQTPPDRRTFINRSLHG